MTPCRESEALDLMRAGLPLYLLAFAARTGLAPDKARDIARRVLDEPHVSRRGDAAPEQQ